MLLNKSVKLRLAVSLGLCTVLLIAVAKVFLGDMAGLGGLYRVAAAKPGLGLSLVGIGYIYQRFVFAETAGLGSAGAAPGGGDGSQVIEPEGPGEPSR